MDAFVIGNHEFDWGIEVVTNYRDIENPLMYAEFPLLGANIFLEGTQTRPEYIDAYTIIQKGQVKVGIIGLIGYGLESSIATSRVSAYEFGNPLYWAEYYTQHLRTQEDVDMVLVVLHDDGRQSLNFNQNVSTWTGNRKVDAVFNGHSHQAYVDMYVRAGADMPAIQSSANGKRLGKVSFDLALDGTINQASATNLTASNDQRLQTAHPLIESIIESYVNQIEPLLNDVIIYAGEYVNQSRLTYYMSELIRKSTDSDIGFHNLGGTRESISNGEGITIAKLYKIFPFDNRIKTVYLKGSTIEQYINTYGGYNSIREGISDFEDNTYYKVATNDYIFDQVDNPFIYGVDIEDTGILIRDILETAMRNQAELGLTFMVDNPIILSASSANILLYISKQEELNI
jgi:2',3'-cyclic-nucleotide 2'-phosphodiesterase (5'-nucleotidase family)